MGGCWDSVCKFEMRLLRLSPREFWWAGTGGLFAKGSPARLLRADGASGSSKVSVAGGKERRLGLIAQGRLQVVRIPALRFLAGTESSALALIITIFLAVPSSPTAGGAAQKAARGLANSHDPH